MNQTATKQQQSDASAKRVAMNLEVHVIPVSDVERSKEFYQRLGWRPDDDVAPTKISLNNSGRYQSAIDDFYAMAQRLTYGTRKRIDGL
jgi:hypothetical protein